MVVLILLIHCLLLLSLSVGICIWSLFRYAVLSVLPRFAIILMGKRELVVVGEEREREREREREGERERDGCLTLIVFLVSCDL